MGNNPVVGYVHKVSDSTLEWYLHNSETLVEDGYVWRDSPTFKYGGKTWCLQVNPYLDCSTYLCFCLQLNGPVILNDPVNGCVNQLYRMYIKNRKTVFWKSPVVADSFTNDHRKGFLFVHKREFMMDMVVASYGDLVLSVQFDPTDCPPSPTLMLRANLRSFKAKEEEKSPWTENKNTSGHQIKEIPMQESAEGKEIPDKQTEAEAITEPKIDSEDKDAVEAGTQLSTDIGKLLESGEGSDLVLRAGDRDFQVHRAVLMARSPVFCRMLQHDMAENREGVVRMTNCSADTAEKLLTYLYAGKVPEITESNVVALHGVADMYDLPLLVSFCRASMIDLLSLDSFCAIYMVAINYDDATLVRACKDFFRQNKKSVMLTQNWISFLEENVEIANDLLLECLD